MSECYVCIHIMSECDVCIHMRECENDAVKGYIPQELN